MSNSTIDIDVLIFGGGVAGLWLLDELRRRGYSVLLAESNALGHGQTVSCQGIIHGGLKYMFDGKLTTAARIISDMPPIWRQCLQGQRRPDLTGTKILSDCCYIWGTGSIKSRIFMTGSTIALRSKPVAVDRPDWPAALKSVPGKVLRVGEQVIDPVSMTRRLATQNPGRLLHIDPARLEFTRNGDQITRIQLQTLDPRPQTLSFSATTIILTAGEGNATLRERAGLSSSVMQRRPLHMTVLRGNLPSLFGHCVGGLRPRITVTTCTSSAGQTIWLIGGQIAEDGVTMDPPQLMAHGKQELLTCLPGLDLTGAEFSTYRVDRAEPATVSGHKPDDVHVIQDGNLLTAWPIKLVLAPRLTDRLLNILPRPQTPDPGPEFAFCPPPNACPPWEHAQWHIVP